MNQSLNDLRHTDASTQGLSRNLIADALYASVIAESLGFSETSRAFAALAADHQALFKTGPGQDS
ncbi:hypothetical protein [Celeribacter sp.]|uniref:hypothetical protein n=1 Tax=Celeribacter sp. TaxID=1890673 RepID=UPI003A8F6BF5